MTENHINLSAGEISSLWTNYMNDTMSKNILGFMLQYVEDTDIKPVLQFAYDSSVYHLNHLEQLFNEEGFAIPNGFSDEDVNMDAPWLFTDVFCITFVTHMASTALIAYGGFLRISSRKDIRDFFSESISGTINLYNLASDVTDSKGINAKFPYITPPSETSYIDSKKYLSGLNPFDEKRPLNAIEVSHLYMNVLTNSIGSYICMAFAQTTTNEEVKDYMLRLKDISQKHLQVLTETLFKNDMETPRIPDVAISESTTETFSNKLMMFLVNMLTSTGFGNYAASAATSLRMDIALNYERLSLEIAKIMKSGADIMIKNGWMEQPPTTPDRNQLANKKN
ncbi:DUF3231 family protein [Ornithinibacillus halophilus]|uniref:DUF3231 family protein n=1 Tax=Ornithinibacillus halophilus TaxID=930117 RepID=A0A1M5L5X0_9BACI|nr:DUF3231 family protein [Ornithinibacillus halophilus]SHG60189.1 Protein of unknown function [Ornithinibacillus halophilus]